MSSIKSVFSSNVSGISDSNSVCRICPSFPAACALSFSAILRFVSNSLRRSPKSSASSTVPAYFSISLSNSFREPISGNASLIRSSRECSRCNCPSSASTAPFFRIASDKAASCCSHVSPGSCASRMAFCLSLKLEILTLIGRVRADGVNNASASL